MSLELAKLRVEMRAEKAFAPPRFIGTTLRGAFGRAFRELACSARRPSCADCLLRDVCVYSYVFETPLPADAEVLRGHERVPHPFVIEAPAEGRLDRIGPGQTIEFGIVLVGRAIGYIPYFVLALSDMGGRGLGRERTRFALQSVVAVDGEGKRSDIYVEGSRSIAAAVPRLKVEVLAPHPPCRRCELTFVTPTCFKDSGEVVGPAVDFHVLARSLLRRASSLSYFHCGEKLEADFPGIAERSRGVRVADCDLTWVTQSRYSARQKKRIGMGGTVGRVAYEGDLGEFMPLVKLGELVHVGKWTAFGMGQYAVGTADGHA